MKMKDAHWGLGAASGWVGGWLLVRGDVATQRFHKADELQQQNYRHYHLMQPLYRVMLVANTTDGQMFV